MNDFGSITTSVICEWRKKNLCHILATSWQILHKKFVVYEMMRQAGGKETLSEDDTPNRTSFEWRAVAVNDDELVRWRFFPKLLNLKETLQKILQPFFAFPIEVELRKLFHFFGILKIWLFLLFFNLTASVFFDGLEGELFFCVKFKYEL